VNTEANAPEAYHRDKLYEEVWAEPVRTVAVRYGVSDVALAKACRRLKVPLPGVGYWAKRKAGKAPARPPLPKLSPEEHAHLEWTSCYRAQQRAQQGSPMVSPEQNTGGKKLEVEVEERLVHPHPLVAEARALLRQPGRRVRFPSFPEEPCLDIDVSRAALSRALRIMNALLKALEVQGYVVENTAPERTTSYYNEARLIPGFTRVRVGEDWIKFGLAESFTRVEVHVPLDWAKEWGGYSIDRVREGTGELSLVVRDAPSGLRRTWNDGKKQRVEDCLGPFISYLPLIAEGLKERRLEAERCHQRRMEEERRRQGVEAKRAEEERRRKELTEALNRWRLAREIRAFVGEVKQRVGAAGLAEQLSERLDWSLAYADAVDPIPSLVSKTLADADEDE
jgi:hypothetical protein